MNRRNILKGVGATAIGGSAVLGSGALTQITATRNVDISVTNDSNSAIALTRGTVNNSGLAQIEENNGTLTFTLSDINANSQLLVGQAESADPSSQTIAETAFEITDNADWGSDNDLATAIDVSVSASAANSGLGLLFLPKSNTDDLANSNTEDYTTSDQDSVAGANLSMAGGEIPELPSRYQQSNSPDNDSARFLLDEESTVGAELLLQADPADIDSEDTSFDITITAKPVSAPEDITLATSLSDRKGNPVGATNFGNFDPRADAGTAYLTATNNSSVGVTASASNAEVSVDPTTIGSGGTSEDVTLDHEQSSDQSTDVTLSYDSKSNTYGPITVPVAPGSAVSRWTMNSDETDNGTLRDVWGSNNLSVDSSVSTGQSSETGTYETGESYLFDGNNNTNNVTALDGANISDFSGEQPHSFALWMNINSWTSQSEGVLHMGAYGEDGGNQSSGLWLQDSSTLNYYFWGNDLQYDVDYQGKWLHVVGTYSGGPADSTNKKLYINGSEQLNPEPSNATPALNLPENPEIQIGSRDGRGRIDGRLSDVRIYDRALSATEVSNLYQTGHINDNN